ncbi:MAG: leucine-rich repeat protein [Eubacteriales bacterium]|jgi:RNA polymerase sigma factor (sigma-70 family)|nr:leucine-rich repeat protein [Eubacteriales bacterium]
MNIIETVALAREGDANAISSLYGEYKNSVYFSCLNLMGNEKEAGIVLQYTFFQAFHKIGLLKNPENFGMWLFVIAANRCRILLRDKNPDIFSSLDEDDKTSRTKNPKFSLNNKTKTEAPADSDLINAIIAVVDELPDADRMAAILYFYCRMNTVQIARIFECGEHVIKRRIIQAADRYKAIIASKSGDYEQLAEYANIEKIGAVFENEAANTFVPDELSENIVATSITLAASAAGNTFFEDKSQAREPADVSENRQPDQTDDNISADLTDSLDSKNRKQLTAQQRIALRNLITIAIILIIAASIIAGSIYVIKKATDSLAISSDLSSGDTNANGPISSEDITLEPITEPPATEPPVTEPPVTEPPVTEPPVTEPPVTEPPVTKPPVTEPPVTEPPEVPDDLNIFFDSNVTGNEVVITRYSGTAKDVDIPASIGGKPVTKIAAYAFQNNTDLIGVKIPASIKTIDVSAFRGCTSLTNVTFSSGLISIGDYAFLECSKLSTFKIPSTVTSIGVSAFGSTSWLNGQKTSFVTVGDGVLLKYLGADSAVTVPDGVKYISNAFYYKHGITSVVLPSGVTTIGTYAFCENPNLKSITLPDTITAIKKDAIYNCPALIEIKVKQGSFAETWCKNNGFEALLAAG